MGDDVAQVPVMSVAPSVRVVNPTRHHVEPGYSIAESPSHFFFGNVSLITNRLKLCCPPSGPNESHLGIQDNVYGNVFEQITHPSFMGKGIEKTILG